MSLTDLQRTVANYTTVTLDAYDKLSAEDDAFSLLTLEHDNRTRQDNPVLLEAPVVLTEVYGWVDHAMSDGVFDKLDWTVPVGPYHAFVRVAEGDETRPQTVIRIEQAADTWPAAMRRRKVKGILNIFRNNLTAYTGQPFFDNTHKHPGTGTFDNLISLGFAVAATPTLAEARAFLDTAQQQLATNKRLQSEITETGKKGNLLVIVHNGAHDTTFERLRTEASYPGSSGGNVINSWAGGFRVMRDHFGFTGGAENYIEVIDTSEPGLGVAWHVQDKDPRNDAWDKKWVPTKFYAAGMEESWGIKPAFPQVAVQGR